MSSIKFFSSNNPPLSFICESSFKDSSITLLVFFFILLRPVLSALACSYANGDCLFLSYDAAGFAALLLDLLPNGSLPNGLSSVP